MRDFFFNLIFSSYESFSKTSFWSLYKQMHKNFYQTHNSLLYNEQLIKIIELTNHARQHVPKWQSKISTEISSLEQSLNIPISMKSLYTKGFPNEVTANISKDNWQYLSSSGTTGRITVVVDFNKRDYLRAGELLNQHLVTGKVLGNQTLDIPPNACNIVCGLKDDGPEPLSAYLLWCIKKNRLFNKNFISDIRGKIERQLILKRTILEPINAGSWSDMTPQLDHYLNTIKSSNIKTLRALPHFLHWLALRVQQRKLELPSLTRITPYGGLAGEVLINKLEQIFDAKFINTYGTGEIGSIGGSIDSPTIINTFSDLVRIEVINNKNMPCKNKEIGNVVVTDLNNYAMPIIRYKIGDTAKVIEEHNGITTKFQLMGRTQEVVTLASGKRIYPSEIQDLFFQFDHITNFKVETSSPSDFRFFVVANGVIDTENIQTKLADLFEIDSVVLNQCDYLLPEESGKYLAVKHKSSLSRPHLTFDIDSIRQRFPILKRETPTGSSLIYLDSAATALKPDSVISAVNEVLSNYSSNIHRSVHFIGDEIEEKFNEVRDKVASFINAASNEIVFVKNTTEAINLVASQFHSNEQFISSIGEHHSNYLPWKECNTHRIEIDDSGQINFKELEQKLSQEKITLVALTHMSNVTGALLDIKHVAKMVHKHNALLLIDAAQSASHKPLDVRDFNCDFLVFSGHKIGAPTGIGVLYGKATLLNKLKPWQLGGGIIQELGAHGPINKLAPYKFEAGTPPIESIIGLGAAIDFISEIGLEYITKHQNYLAEVTKREITKHLPYATVLGGVENNSGPFSIVIPDITSHTIARALSDRYSICVRSGFHCAQPLHTQLNSPASLRISYWLYNTEEEIVKTITAISELCKYRN